MEFTTGNVLSADVEAIVNTVNCVGFMGRGIAAQFKRSHPENFRAYEAACKRGEVVPGRMFIFATGRLTNPRWIVNFPTKRHWRGKSRMEDIESGLTDLVAEVLSRKITSIAIPPLGCGLGGLSWDEVRPRIERAFAGIDGVQVTIYEPTGAPEVARQATTGEVPKVTPGRAVLVGLMERYLAGLMDPWVSLLEVHKLMYFAQVAGEPLRLKYVKAPYGPYAENLRHVLAAIEGYMISGYGAGGDQPGKALTLVPGAVEGARSVLASHPKTLGHFEQVARLVEGFESSFGLELLSTVHWVVAEEGASSDEEATQAVHTWGPQKQQFTPRQISVAARRLAEAGFIEPLPCSIQG